MNNQTGLQTPSGGGNYMMRPEQYQYTDRVTRLVMAKAGAKQ